MIAHQSQNGIILMNKSVKYQNLGNSTVCFTNENIVNTEHFNVMQILKVLKIKHKSYRWMELKGQMLKIGDSTYLV